MRDIKFRAWDKINNLMIPWEVLKMISTNAIGETRIETMHAISDDSYITVTDLAGNISEIVSSNPKIETKLKSRTYVRYNKGHNIWIDDNLIKLQFTGLKDKNGKEIYEGDIIGGYPHGTVYVRWSNKYACFESVSVDNDTFPNLLANDIEDCFDEWEVIGNTHENPELIK